MKMRYFLLPFMFESKKSTKIKINTSINSNIEDLKADNLIAKEVSSTAIPPLSGKKNNLFADNEPDCVDFTYSNFKFRICPFNHITQTSLTSYSADKHNLGVYSGFATDRDEIIGMQFLFGDIDGCKNHRETLIRFSCGNSYRMTKFNEIETCQYEGEMRFPYFCDPDRRLIFPILTQNGKLRWKKLRAAIKQDIITQDGIEFYENLILIDEGLRVNRTSVMNSPQYAQWLSKNTVRNECDAEIKSLKQEMLKLKSDLATCQSQMEFGDEDPLF